MRPDNPIRHFDPRKLAHCERENYAAYLVARADREACLRPLSE
jgi:hypothetical protein